MLVDYCSCYWTVGDSQQLSLSRKLSSPACLSPPTSRMHCNETKCKKNERGVEQGKVMVFIHLEPFKDSYTDIGPP